MARAAILIALAGAALLGARLTPSAPHPASSLHLREAAAGVPARIPSGARQLGLSATVVGPRARRSLRLTAVSHRQIEAVGALLDSLPLLQPRPGAVFSCPADFGTFTIVFYPRPGAAPSATASGEIAGCGFIHLVVPGSPALTLQGGRGALATLERELHVVLLGSGRR